MTPDLKDLSMSKRHNKSLRSNVIVCMASIKKYAFLCNTFIKNCVKYVFFVLLVIKIME